MNKNNINNLFERLDGEFDIETPNLGHETRFLDKLKDQSNIAVNKETVKKHYWKPLLAAAASILLCLALFTIIKPEPKLKDLASVSPELSETQSFFTAAIAKELVSLNDQRTPETQVIIDDALKQIQILENEYESLKTDLTESGDDQRVIYAMISNFQNRIDVLQNVIEYIKEIKQLKQNNNENTITI